MKIRLYLLSILMQVAKLHLSKLGVELEELSDDQAKYIGDVYSYNQTITDIDEFIDQGGWIHRVTCC